MSADIEAAHSRPFPQGISRSVAPLIVGSSNAAEHNNNNRVPPSSAKEATVMGAHLTQCDPSLPIHASRSLWMTPDGANG